MSFTGRSTVQFLTAGPRTLRIVMREDGAALDTIVLQRIATNTAISGELVGLILAIAIDVLFIATGDGPAESNYTSTCVSGNLLAGSVE